MLRLVRISKRRGERRDQKKEEPQKKIIRVRDILTEETKKKIFLRQRYLICVVKSICVRDILNEETKKRRTTDKNCLRQRYLYLRQRYLVRKVHFAIFYEHKKIICVRDIFTQLCASEMS